MVFFELVVQLKSDLTNGILKNKSHLFPNITSAKHNHGANTFEFRYARVASRASARKDRRAAPPPCGQGLIHTLCDFGKFYKHLYLIFFWKKVQPSSKGWGERRVCINSSYFLLVGPQPGICHLWVNT